MSTTVHSPSPAPDASRDQTPHPAEPGDLRAVRSLEASIAERLEAARDSREVVLTATREAETILQTARARAAEAAEEAQAAIHVDALRDAERIRSVADQRCAAIAATAAARRDDDVAALLSGVLPAEAGPSTARATGPQQARGQEAPS